MKNDKRRLKTIREHFDIESQDFDSIIKMQVPFYDLFIEALVNVLPFEWDKAIRVADLGCGTGALTCKVKEKFPNSEIACVDFSPEMLRTAGRKLSKYTGISYHKTDILDFDLNGYDAVLSSLCLHHIGTENKKKKFFGKVHGKLSQGGAFYIYDVVLAPGNALQNVYTGEWKRYLAKNLSPRDIKNIMRKHHKEDRPCVLMDEIEWLKEAGFENVDIICKFYNGAVYGGVKPGCFRKGKNGTSI